MGGQAFPELGSKLSRLPPKLYFELRATVKTLLGDFYENVVIPAEAPGKVDYGDIDFLVCGPASSIANEQLKKTHDKIGQALGAARSIHQGQSSSYAIPFPSDPTTFAQVDVHVCQTDGFPWVVFKQSYGDLWQILGLMIRPWGLTATEEALYVRIPEIEAEAASRYKSMLFLANSPTITMQFLGLDANKYVEGFRTEESIFEWIANSRLFAKALFDENGTKASDRQRMRKRPMHRRFITHWLEIASPSDKAQLNEEGKVNRGDFLEETLDWFGNRLKHDELLREHRKNAREKRFFEVVAEEIPLVGDKKNLALRALKRWVTFCSSDTNGRRIPTISDSPKLDENEQPFWTVESDLTDDELLLWISQNWEEVKGKERERIKLAYEGRKGLGHGSSGQEPALEQ